MAPLYMLIWLSIIAALIHVNEPKGKIFYIVEAILIISGALEVGYIEQPTPGQSKWRQFVWIISTIAFAVYFIMCAFKLV
jgi:hypothetical protein